jgi:hypothetical protein
LNPPPNRRVALGEADFELVNRFGFDCGLAHGYSICGYLDLKLRAPL